MGGIAAKSHRSQRVRADKALVLPPLIVCCVPSAMASSQQNKETDTEGQHQAGHRAQAKCCGLLGDLSLFTCMKKYGQETMLHWERGGLAVWNVSGFLYLFQGERQGSSHGKARQLSRSISEGSCQVWHKCPLSLSTVLVVTELFNIFFFF